MTQPLLVVVVSLLVAVASSSYQPAAGDDGSCLLDVVLADDVEVSERPRFRIHSIPEPAGGCGVLESAVRGVLPAGRTQVDEVCDVQVRAVDVVLTVSAPLFSVRVPLHAGGCVYLEPSLRAVLGCARESI